ncbi:hypothetical protein [Bacillus sonorensis]|uniref:hypothetical protein n=1 Tax=Bacillus sonorensis TaxID=119858 RepID=UPI001F32D368|nr:hypothetical protein [Bacillus sonorensis]MCF7618620.1 hypothetical protein [Bacillus sonorensis]MCY7858846.1 hypothetical protein [Bacillus sonorensis]MCY8565629.1 hypothetical protein [Bacillus sonorensis]MDI3411733.1 hypothetical protein [Bacillus sonorensis]
MVEVDLKVKGKTAFAYRTDCIPREGECLDISHDEISGHFKVAKVTHRIIYDRASKNIANYVIVEAE